MDDISKHFGLGLIIDTDPNVDNSQQKMRKYKPSSQNVHAEEKFRDRSSGYEDSRSDGHSDSQMKNRPNSRKKSTVQPSKAVHNIFRAHMSGFADAAESDSHIRSNPRGDYSNPDVSHEEYEGAGESPAPEDYIGWNTDNNPDRPPIYEKMRGPSTYASDTRLVNVNEFQGRLSYARAWKPDNPKNVTQSIDFMLAEEHDPSHIDEYLKKVRGEKK